MVYRNQRLLTFLSAGLLIVVSLNCAGAWAQASRRPPTAEELAVVARYRQCILNVLSPVANEDWQEDPTGDYDIPDDFMVTTRMVIPFEITGVIQRSYRVTPGSPYYQRVMAPLLEKAQGMPDPQAMKNLFAHVDRTELTINVQFNWIELTQDAQPPALQTLDIPGAMMAWQIPEDRQKKVTLLFGDPAGKTRTQSGVGYRFRQKGKYLAIENVVVELEGNSTRIDEVLKTIDWKQINTAIYTSR